MSKATHSPYRDESPPPLNIAKELAGLAKLTMAQLRARYAEAFGERTLVNNKAWLVKRLAWRLQANAEGGLSERAARRAAALANEADLRLSPPRPTPQCQPTIPQPSSQNGARLPPPGTVLTRSYKGRVLSVQVLASGFEFEGTLYKSLSAVAKTITGSHCNGFLFFKLVNRKEKT